MLVPHGSDGSRALSVSGTVVKLVAGVATIVAASLLAATIGVVSHSVDLARSQRLERANHALSSEVQRLGQRVGALSDTLAVISRRDQEMRLVAGLDPLSPEVQQVGIGGPAGAWPEREQLLTEGGTIGRAAFGVHLDVDALLRRANLLVSSQEAAAESIAAHKQEFLAMPSIMPTMGFLTSKFSLIRYHPILHENRPHEGIDITAAYGTKIIAPAAGRVIKVGYENGYGNMVVLDHGYGLETRYAHMSHWAVKVGQSVKRGDLLGYVGSTGLSTGPHLHYEVLRDGRAVDPLRFILPDAIAD
jgi:murein DD-endopeptidase MepM/ murein hydrolase activator NlpD